MMNYLWDFSQSEMDILIEWIIINIIIIIIIIIIVLVPFIIISFFMIFFSERRTYGFTIQTSNWTCAAITKDS